METLVRSLFYWKCNDLYKKLQKQLNFIVPFSEIKTGKLNQPQVPRGIPVAHFCKIVTSAFAKNVELQAHTHIYFKICKNPWNKIFVLTSMLPELAPHHVCYPDTCVTTSVLRLTQ